MKGTQIVTFMGEELFRTDQAGEPMLPETATELERKLATALCSAFDELEAVRGRAEQYLDLFRRTP